MANEKTNTFPEEFPMKGGDGPYSYSNNSSYQKKGLDFAKEMIEEAIAEKLDVQQLFSNPFHIADLGCSVGPNTFKAVQNIIEAVNLKYQSHGLSSHPLEFQVLFNDHSSNDFNMLFTSLPPNRQYFAAAVPGSFHGRLFPKASLHFVHSSYALHWLSKVPKEVVDHSSPAWNKGQIYYTSSPKDVAEAYSAQFAMDMESFLQARAQELVCGGLMAILISSLPNGVHPSKSTLANFFDLLGSSLMDMAKMGLVNEAIVDSFNLPIYITSPQELEALIEKNGCFSIERMEPLTHRTRQEGNVQACSLHCRAGFEGLIGEYFGTEFMGELFERYTMKVAESSLLSNLINDPMNELFVLLKRK